jgi:hypothetical protein
LNNQRKRNHKKNIVQLTLFNALLALVILPAIVIVDLVFAANTAYLFPNDFTDDLGQDYVIGKNRSNYQFSGDPYYPGVQYGYPENNIYIQDHTLETLYPQAIYPLDSYTNDQLRRAPSNKYLPTNNIAPANNSVYNPYTYVTDIEDSIPQPLNRAQQNMQQLNLQRSLRQKQQPDYERRYQNWETRGLSQHYNYPAPGYGSESHTPGRYAPDRYQYPVQAIPVPVFTLPGTLPGTVPGVVTPSNMVPGFSHLSPDYSSSPWGGFIPGAGLGGFPGTGFGSFPGIGLGSFPGVNSFPVIGTYPYSSSGLMPSVDSFIPSGLTTPYPYR